MLVYLRLLKESFGFALNALRNNKLRTLLSLLGVTIGIFSIKGAAKRMKIKREIEAVTPDNRPLPPELTLIMDCPIMAHPPIPPNKPFNIFPNPCAKLSLFPLPLESVSSSIKLRVIKDSIRPTAANRNAVESIKFQWFDMV